MSRHAHGFSGEVTLLKAWSDLTFLEWQRRSKKATPEPSPVDALSYVIRRINPASPTMRIITKVLTRLDHRASNREHNPPRWQNALRFRMGQGEENDENFRALMGTTAASGVGLLLAQHKEQLGIKCVKWILLFKGPTNIVHLIFKVVPESEMETAD